MNFVAKVEEQLRDLASQARNKHAGVTEASNSAISHLKSLQTQYVIAVRKASTYSSLHPTTALFQSQDILHPFLLAGNYRTASHNVISIALNGIQLLLDDHAVCCGDAVHIVRILSIQGSVCAGIFQNNNNNNTHGWNGWNFVKSKSNSSINNSNNEDKIQNPSNTIYTHHSWKEAESLSIKLLQLLIPIMQSHTLELTFPVLSQCFNVSLILLSSTSHKNKAIESSEKIAIIRKVKGAAISTLKQIVGILLEKCRRNDELQKLAKWVFKDIVELMDNEIQSDEIDKNKHMKKQYKTPGPFLNGLQGAGMGKHGIINCPSRFLCFDLLEMFICSNLELYTEIQEFLCPLLCNALMSELWLGKEDSDDGEKILLTFGLVVKASQLTMKVVKSLDTIKNGMNVEDSIEEKFIENRSDTTDITNSTFNIINHTEHKHSSETTITTEGTLRTDNTNIRNNHYAITKNTFNTTNTNMKTKLGSKCCMILICWIQFISATTEVYKDTNIPISNYKWVNPTNEFLYTYEESIRIPPSYIWRAGISLESLHILLTHHFDIFLFLQTSSPESTNGSLLATVATVVSEFSKIACQNPGGIRGVIQTLEGDSEHDTNTLEQKPNIEVVNSHPPSFLEYIPIEPQILAQARDITKLTEYSDVNFDPTYKTSSHTRFTSEGSIPSSALEDISSLNIFECPSGEILWLSFQCLLSLLHNLKLHSGSKGDASLCNKSQVSHQNMTLSFIQTSFTPILSTLEQFFEKFPTCIPVIQYTLSGYISLATIIFSQEIQTNRRALLQSLCQRALPYRVEKSIPQPLQEHHMMILTAIIHILHDNSSFILQDWDIFVTTLEQLSVSSVLHMNLSWTYSHVVLSLSHIYSRLARFTTCLSQESITYFFDALIKLSTSVNITSKISKSTHSSFTIKSTNENRIPSVESKETSFGGKLLVLAGRALSVASTPLTKSPLNPTATDKRLSTIVRSSSCYKDEYCHEVHTTLSSLVKLSTLKEDLMSLPFAFVLLPAVLMENSFRFAVLSSNIIDHICALTILSDYRPTRIFAMDILASIITLGLSDPTLVSNQPRVLVETPKNSVHEYLRVVFLTNNVSATFHSNTNNSLQNIPHDQLLSPLCKTLSNHSLPDTTEMGLTSLHIILEKHGHVLKASGWIVILETLSSLSGCWSHSIINRSGVEWSRCNALSFRLLKFIIDDFYEDLPEIPNNSYATRRCVLDCCACFGKSTQDLNTSLTATGMLWTIAEQDSSSSFFGHVVSKLAWLVSDGRPEIRNCSVKTLFYCVGGLGHRLTTAQWANVFHETIFGIIDQVTNNKDCSNFSMKNNNTTNTTPTSRYKVTVHYSRDTSTKQWATTFVLILRGLEQILRQFFYKLILSTNYIFQIGPSFFYLAWSRILSLAYKCATEIGGRECAKVGEAGIDLLFTCMFVSCKTGIGKNTITARIGTNMQVINGSLRRVSPAKTNMIDSVLSSSENIEHTVIEESRIQLFDQAFSIFEEIEKFLRENDTSGITESLSSTLMENYTLQICTKLSQGFVKLYEYCRANEMGKNHMTFNQNSTDHNYEQRLLQLIIFVIKISCKKKISNCSNVIAQTPKIGMSLLNDMVKYGSVNALVALVILGGDAFYTTYLDEISDTSIQYLAATSAVQHFTKCTPSPSSKLQILCLILNNHHIFYQEHNDLSNIRYTFLKKLFEFSLSSLPPFPNINDSNTIYTFLLLFINFLSSHTPQELHIPDILDILSTIIHHIPKHKSTEFSNALVFALQESAQNLLVHSENKDKREKAQKLILTINIKEKSERTYQELKESKERNNFLRNMIDKLSQEKKELRINEEQIQITRQELKELKEKNKELHEIIEEMRMENKELERQVGVLKLI